MIIVDDADTKIAQADESPAPANSAWKPGVRARFPYAAFGVLCLVILCAVASVIVLVLSDAKSEEQWPKRIAPNVILSIFNGISNICISVAVLQGVSIAWWRKAMRGATVRELHTTWAFGSSIIEIVTNIKCFNVVALTALITKLTIIDGILFQRATSTYIDLGLQQPINITTFPTESFPITAELNNYGNETGILSLAFAYDVGNWLMSSRGTIRSTFEFSDCEGICYVEAPGLGYAAECTNTSENVDYIRAAQAAIVNGTLDHSSTTNLFEVKFTNIFATPTKNYTWIKLEMLVYESTYDSEQSPDEKCPGIVTRRTCALRPAIIYYPVTMLLTSSSSIDKSQKNPSISVMLGKLNDTNKAYMFPDGMDSSMNQIPGFRVGNYINITDQPVPLGHSRSAGIASVLQNYYGSQATLQTSNNSTEWSVSTVGQYPGMVGFSDDICPDSSSDPLEDIILGLNSLMFIMSDDFEDRGTGDLSTNNGSGIIPAYTAQLEGIQYTRTIHYQTNRAYMYSGLASTVVCVCLLLPAFWGFWELGRPVTLAPLEAANAFQAPVLSAVVTGDVDVKELVKAVGDNRLQYKLIEVDGEKMHRFVEQ